MNYNIEGTILTNPVITLHDALTKYDENENEEGTSVSFNIADENDGVSMTLSDNNIPATHKKAAIKAWVNNRLKEFEI